MLTFEVDQAHQARDLSGLPMLHPDVVRRCQFMFGVRFHWFLTASHEGAPLSLELAIPSISHSAYRTLFHLKVGEP